MQAWIKNLRLHAWSRNGNVIGDCNSAQSRFRKNQRQLRSIYSSRNDALQNVLLLKKPKLRRLKFLNCLEVVVNV